MNINKIELSFNGNICGFDQYFQPKFETKINAMKATIPTEIRNG